MMSNGSGLGRSAVAASAVSVAGWFQSQVVLRGDAIALQEGDRTLSYRALNERVNRLAHWLLANKVTRGDRIAVLSENRSEYVEIELAAAKLGIITACQNWRQADGELSHCIRLVEPKLIVVSERHAPALGRIDHGAPQVLRLGDDYERALAHAGDASEPPH